MAGAPHKCLPVTRCSLGRGAGLVILVPNFPQEPSRHPCIPRPETFAAVQVTFTFGI